MLPAKPPYTHPCNNCGLCCQTQLCPVGEMAFPGATAPCPGLVVTEEKAVCVFVMVESAAAIDPMLARTLGIGTGCSMPDENTTDDEIDAFDRRSRIAVFGPRAT